MRRGLNAGLSIGTVPLALLYALAFAASYADPCTSGEPDGFAAGMIAGSVVALVTTMVLIASRRVDGPVAWVRGLVPGILLVLLVFHAPHFVRTTILGHHLCGAAFDEYLADRRSWVQDAFWPVQLAWMVAMSVSAMWPLRWHLLRRA